VSDQLAAVEGWVRAQLVDVLHAGLDDITQLVAHPHLPWVACTLWNRDDPVGPSTPQVGLVDLDSMRWEPLNVGGERVSSPAWSPDGRQLCVLVSDGAATTVWVVDVNMGEALSASITHRLSDVDGSVERAAWSPDGTTLCLIVADFGAEISDVHGSGTVAGPTDAESWRPLVTPAPEHGRRTLHVWTPGLAASTPLCGHLNVWETGWLGPERLAVVASEGSGEGAWYAARMLAIGLDGSVEQLHTSGRQLAAPSGSPTGSCWSVIDGPASDRGLLAGSLIVGDTGGPGRCLDTGEVDVCATGWLDDHRLAYAGLRGLATVLGIVDVATGIHEELLSTDGASGLYQPEMGAHIADGRLVCVLERHDQPPTLTVVDGGIAAPVLSTADEATARLVAHTGSTSACSWISSDGVEIEGVLTVPTGAGPHPLVVIIHGGPVAAWRDGWIGKDPYAALLVARGFAVLRPNPRGSAGRGAAFVDRVIGDMGGADLDDVLTGVAALVDRGVAAAGRIGITGNSYGGYLATWIPCWSEVFGAAVARSPVTDWRSQHLTGNLAEFDEIFVGGDPFDPDSAYRTRSPLTYHHQIKTPILLTAGAHDLATPVSQAQQLHRALLCTGVPTQLAIYPEEGHGVRGPDAIADQLARTIHWFETYLTDGGGA
jgi:dipeptidyl aminopeptidase/acylaminoacyl peptidase